MIEVTAEEYKVIADLIVGSMMFDMDIDWEAATLVQKTKQKSEPYWLTKWKDKEYGSDRRPEDYEGGSDRR